MCMYNNEIHVKYTFNHDKIFVSRLVLQLKLFYPMLGFILLTVSQWKINPESCKNRYGAREKYRRLIPNVKIQYLQIVVFE